MRRKKQKRNRHCDDGSRLFLPDNELAEMRRQHDGGLAQPIDIGWNDRSAYPFAYPFVAGWIGGTGQNNCGKRLLGTGGERGKRCEMKRIG